MDEEALSLTLCWFCVDFAGEVAINMAFCFRGLGKEWAVYICLEVG